MAEAKQLIIEAEAKVRIFEKVKKQAEAENKQQNKRPNLRLKNEKRKPKNPKKLPKRQKPKKITQNLMLKKYICLENLNELVP